MITFNFIIEEKHGSITGDGEAKKTEPVTKAERLMANKLMDLLEGHIANEAKAVKGGFANFLRWKL